MEIAVPNLLKKEMQNSEKEKTRLTRRVLTEKFEFMGIGAVVKVKNPGQRYSRYIEKFKEMKFKNSEPRKGFLNDFFLEKEFIIFAKSSSRVLIGFENEETLICGIEDEEGNQFLFHQSALSYV